MELLQIVQGKIQESFVLRDTVSDELADNMKKFDKQGIKKLVSSLDTTQIADTLDRFDAIAKASANKHFVGGTPKEIAGDARIIFKTGAVE